MSTATGHPVDPLDRTVLETEQSFLLASLDDLDTALCEGDLEPEDYARLRDDYTARAAAVARSLREGRDRRPVSPSPPGWRRAMVAALVVVFAVGAGLLLAGSMGLRLPGQSVTGNAQSGVPGQIRSLEQRVKDNPDDPAGHRALAQARLQNRDLVGALKEFDAAARLDPADAEARAYAGWIVFQAGLTEEAMRRLDQAVAVAADYPDARLFRGMVLLRGRNDPAGATAELERYLALVPAGPLDSQVRTVLEEARAKAGGQPGPSGPGPAPPAGPSGPLSGELGPAPPP